MKTAESETGKTMLDEAAEKVLQDETGADQPGESTGADQDTKTEKMVKTTVYKFELALNEYLKDKNPDLALSDTEMSQHSELLSEVLIKNISLEMLKNSPEFALSAYTAFMISQRLPIIRKMRVSDKAETDNKNTAENGKS